MALDWSWNLEPRYPGWTVVCVKLLKWNSISGSDLYWKCSLCVNECAGLQGGLTQFEWRIFFANYPDHLRQYGGFLKWWYQTIIGFPTKTDHFGVFRGYHHLRKHPYVAPWVWDEEADVTQCFTWRQMTAMATSATSSFQLVTEIPRMFHQNFAKKMTWDMNSKTKRWLFRLYNGSKTFFVQ